MLVISGGSRGKGPGWPSPPPLFLDQTEARRAENIFGGDRAPPLSQCLDSALVMVSEWCLDGLRILSMRILYVVADC